MGHRVIEVGCVELIDGKLTGKHWHAYLNPNREVSEDAKEKTGITAEFLADKSEFCHVKEDLIGFISNSELIIYDAPFVIDFLNHELALITKNPDRIEDMCSILDVKEIARRLFPGSDNSINELAKRVFVNASPRFLSGALITAEIVADIFLAITSDSLKQILDQLREDEGIYVNTFSEFIEAADGISRTALCRGVSNKDYLLLPSLFRKSLEVDPDITEHNLMWVFKTHAKALLPRLPSTEIEWLTVAQHHGLPTRLLDWSLSPLVACFFAVNSVSKHDACVYIYDIGKFKKEEDINIKKLKDIVAFFPSHATNRITAQSGMFTVHPTNNMTLEPKDIRKILIPSKVKSEFRDKLSKFGINQGTLFPDLDGLSNHIRYLNGY
jgi:DNA polymerase III epsilon subunit